MIDIDLAEASTAVKAALQSAKADMRKRADAGQPTAWAVLTSTPYIRMTTVVMPRNGVLNVYVPPNGAGAFILKVDHTTRPLSTDQWNQVDVDLGDGLTVVPSPVDSGNVGQVQYFLD